MRELRFHNPWRSRSCQGSLLKMMKNVVIFVLEKSRLVTFHTSEVSPNKFQNQSSISALEVTKTSKNHSLQCWMIQIPYLNTGSTHSTSLKPGRTTPDRLCPSSATDTYLWKHCGFSMGRKLKHSFASWWLQPISKVLVKLDNLTK